MNSNNRIAATLFPRDIVCLRNICINTLHKGDDDDDEDIIIIIIYGAMGTAHILTQCGLG
jgi:hypothetical protein